MTRNKYSKALNIEKPELEIRFIPIICSAPLIYAHSHGFLEKNGLRVNLKPAPGWSGIKELMTHGIVDAAHMLSPMPLACNLGIDGRRADIRLAAVQNVNGQALTLAKKHLGIKDVRDMKGFCFGVPYRFSMHYYLLCHFLASHGLDPLKDITIREVAPPRMPYYLEKQWVDGIFAPEPFNQIPVHRGTGFIYILSKDIWSGHPCCSFATSQGFIDKYPNTYRALLSSVLEAELVLHRADPDQRKAIAREICGPQHLNQPDPVPVEQVLAGHFPDGKGHWHDIPDRIDFIPHPWMEYGSWMLSQMHRWGQLPGKIDHHKVLESVFRQDTHEMAVGLGFDPADRPRLEGIQPFTGEAPLAYARKQPFCAFQEEPPACKNYGLPYPVRERLSKIIENLARVSGGEPADPLETTADDEIGLLEQVLNELALNTRFTREALAEHGEMLEKRVQERTAQLEEEVRFRKQAELARNTLLHETEERVKELTCMYGVARSIRERDALEDIFRDVVALIPPGWQFPDITCARVRFDGKEYRSDAFLETPWKLSSDIVVDDQCLGAVDIYYTEPRPQLMEGPFFKEERHLIDGIARALSEAVEHRQAEEALRTSEAKFRAISESALDAVIMIDASENIVLWNSTAEKMFGYSGEEAIGRNVHAILAPGRYRQEAAKGFSRFCGSGKGSIIGSIREIEAMRKDGSEMPAELSISPIKLEDQWWAVAFVRDITERKRAEKELQEQAGALRSTNKELHAANLAAKAATKVKSEFLANMSHEIRTPMNGIIGMSGLLADTTLTNEQHEYMDTIRQSANSLLMVINDILDFSKIEAGQLNLESLDFDLRAILDSTIDLMALNAQEKGLELTCTIGPEVPISLGGDPERLRQILLNLVSNAIKFTAEGEVAVHIGLDQDDGGRATLRFAVTDTGIGVAPEKQHLLFDAFSQADATTSRKYGGTGLGLAICKKLVELMNGRIGVESELGKGSSFWFTAVFEKRSPVKESTWEKLEDIRGQRILVVDDNATNRRLMRQMLHSWGCRHEEAPDARSALEALRAAVDAGDPFSAAILDMMMPEIDGIMLGKMIKEDPALVDTALVMMTSLGRSENAAREESIGFAGHLTKPVKQSTLYDCLTNVLSRTKTAAATATRNVVIPKTVSWDKEHPPRILLAEDNLINQKVILGILKKLDCKADVVDNGQASLRALETAAYDLVLMDVQMPEMDGFEVTRLIRDQASNVRDHDIPIIAITAHAMKGDREKCLEAGMNDYLSKPINPTELAETIRKWLSTKGAEATTSVGFEPVGPSGTENTFAEQAFDVTSEPNNSNDSFDISVLLARYDGNIEFIRELIELFLNTHGTDLSDIRQAIDHRDSKALEHSVHKLRSSLGALCANTVMEAATRLEKIGHSGDMTEADDAMVGLDSDISRFKSALAMLIKTV